MAGRVPDRQRRPVAGCLGCPLPPRAPSWAAMGRRRPPRGRPLRHRAHSPGTGVVAGGRIPAKCPSSAYPMSRPPPAAGDAPAQSGARSAPREFADSGQRLGTASQHPPASRTRPGSRHLCPQPASPPPPPPIGKTLHPSAGTVPWHPSLRKREIKTLPYRCPGINVPAVKTNVASSRQHLFLINAVTLP